MSHSAMQPLLQKVDQHEERLKGLAGRMKEISLNVSTVHRSIEVEPTSNNAQEKQRAETDHQRHKRVEMEEKQLLVLELDGLKHNFRHHHKMRRGFRSLCSIVVYWAAILFEFWCANHTQSLNNSYVRLSGALLSDLEKIETATTSHEMWNTIKDDIIVNTVFRQSQSLNNSEAKVNLTYVFADASYLVGDLAITFSFGRYEKSNEPGYRRIVPFQQHNHHENQNEPRHLLLDGEKIPVRPNKELPHGLTSIPGLKNFMDKLVEGYTVAIPSTADKHAIKTLLESYDTFVENQTVFDVSLDFMVLDPTVNPKDWDLAAVTTIGLVHSEYTVSPQWTTSRGIKIQGAKDSKAQGSAKLKILPRDLYNFGQHPRWQIAHILIELLLLLYGIWEFVIPHILLQVARYKLNRAQVAAEEEYYLQKMEEREGDGVQDELYTSTSSVGPPSSVAGLRDSGAKRSASWLSWIKLSSRDSVTRSQDLQEAMLQDLQEKNFNEMRQAGNVPHDRSGGPKSTWSVFALVLLLTLYVLIVLAILWRKEGRHNLVRPEKVCDNPANAKAVMHHFEDYVWPAISDVFAFDALRDFNIYVQICIVILFSKRIKDHAEFHPQIASLARAFASIQMNFMTVFITYVFMSFVTGACSSIFWGDQVAPVAGFGSAAWLVFQSEFKVTSLKDNVPQLLNLAFCIMCDLLIFKILTGMIVDAYKKLSNRKTIESETGFIDDYYEWIKQELTWTLFSYDREQLGYVHPAHMAVAAHLHREIEGNKADAVKESSDQSHSDKARAEMRRSMNHEFIEDVRNIRTMFNRVWNLVQVGQQLLPRLSKKENEKKKFQELTSDIYDIYDSIKEAQEARQTGYEEALDIEQQFGKEDDDIRYIKEDPLARISIKLATIHKGSRVSKFQECTEQDVDFALVNFGIRRSVAVQKYVIEHIERENKKKANKAKADKEALSKEQIKQLRREAVEELKAGPYFEDTYIEEMIKHGKSVFDIFDVNCVGMMDVRFTGYWVMSMKHKGLRQDMTEDDFLEYMERDPYFWEWEELEKILKDPKNHAYGSANMQWMNLAKAGINKLVQTNSVKALSNRLAKDQHSDGTKTV